ncbi:MAG: lipoprotein signal peptidase [Crocinitomicaceae bacterium]|nr:lipoprotein signal peptidase [Crocinitomicaceae bacterium]
MIRRNLMIVGSIVALILFFDQVLKIWTKTQVAFMDEPINLLGSWFKLVYIENQGMAFGTTLGSGIWAKLSLSIFRIIAITGIAWYWVKQAKEGAKLEFLIAIGFIFSGAIGNLIDSMLYDFIFKFDPCLTFNHLEGSGIKKMCEYFGEVEVRHQGFLFGNVVDMFQFDIQWPKWMPGIGGNEVFPAIWNLADGAITVGVVMILLRQKTYFPKEKTTSPSLQQE